MARINRTVFHRSSTFKPLRIKRPTSKNERKKLCLIEDIKFAIGVPGSINLILIKNNKRIKIPVKKKKRLKKNKTNPNAVAR